MNVTKTSIGWWIFFFFFFTCRVVSVVTWTWALESQRYLAFNDSAVQGGYTSALWTVENVNTLSRGFSGCFTQCENQEWCLCPFLDQELCQCFFPASFGQCSSHCPSREGVYTVNLSLPFFCRLRKLCGVYPKLCLLKNALSEVEVMGVLSKKRTQSSSGRSHFLLILIHIFNSKDICALGRPR